MAEETMGLYLVQLTIDNPGLLGSPVLTLDLAVNAATGQVNGSGEISQSVTPQSPPYHLGQVTGHVFHTGFQNDTLLVHLTGEYLYSVPPPAIGTFVGPFSAGLAVDRSWTGKGSYSYGRHQVAQCRVRNTSPNAQDTVLRAEPTLA
jgi:hypothetical protein